METKEFCIDKNQFDVRTIWNKYDKNERCYVQWLYPRQEWNYEMYYPAIKCLMFEYCDRGIHCWKTFGIFLKKAFPNLKCLFISQNFNMTDCYLDGSPEKNHVIDFFKDDWLEYILVIDEQSGYSITNDSYSYQFKCRDTSYELGTPSSVVSLRKLDSMLINSIKMNKDDLNFVYLESDVFDDAEA